MRCPKRNLRARERRSPFLFSTAWPPTDGQFLVNTRNVQCAETNFALVKIHQKGKVEHGAVVGSEGVHGHVIDLKWLEKGHIFISRAF